MKKIIFVVLCSLLIISFTGCDNKKQEIKEYPKYEFGESITIQVNNEETIKGNVIEDKGDKVIVLQENGSNVIASYEEIGRIIEKRKTEWNNTLNIDLLSFQVIIDNLKLTDNHIIDGFTTNEDESFLYGSDVQEGYWASSKITNGANCYESDKKCGWAIYKYHMELIDTEYKREVRLVIEISKDFITN